MKWINLAALLLIECSFVAAQRHCISVRRLEQTLQEDSILEQQWQRHFYASIGKKNEVLQEVIIPVVVHVVYRNAAQNISNEQIQSQMQVLNEDFGRQNQGSDSFWPQAADTRILFVLASCDPRGKPTSGIQRRYTRRRTFSADDKIKRYTDGGVDPWPTDRYLNIWVGDLGNQLMGYAQFPGLDSLYDGVVINYRHFGRVGDMQPPFHLGRTCTHEVGHWLGLKHIWGDGGCSVDDGIADTPKSDAPNFNCTRQVKSCGSIDMVENFMDYTADACMSLFTKGQAERMHAVLARNGNRATLSYSNYCETGNNLPERHSENATLTPPFLLYPNPATNYFLLKRINRAEEEIPLATGRITIFNMMGELILQKDCSFVEQQISVDISNLQTGPLLVRLSATEKVGWIEQQILLKIE